MKLPSEWQVKVFDPAHLFLDVGPWSTCILVDMNWVSSLGCTTRIVMALKLLSVSRLLAQTTSMLLYICLGAHHAMYGPLVPMSQLQGTNWHTSCWSDWTASFAGCLRLQTQSSGWRHGFGRGKGQGADAISRAPVYIYSINQRFQGFAWWHYYVVVPQLRYDHPPHSATWLAIKNLTWNPDKGKVQGTNLL